MNSGLHRASTYGDLICHALSQRSTEVAFEEEHRTITYAQAAKMVEAMVSNYRAWGLERGDGIAFLSGNSATSWLAQAAAFVMGCRVTPLHSLASLDDHVYICADAEVSALVYDPGQAGGRLRAREISEAVPAISTMVSTRADDAGAPVVDEGWESCSGLLKSDSHASEVAWLPYTGGTTGLPKGVMLPHRSMVTNVWLTLTQFDWPKVNKFGAFAPISHGCGLMILPTLLQGGSVYIADHFEPVKFLEAVRDRGVSSTFLVPTMIYVLLDELDGRSAPGGLETIVYGASAMSPTRMVEALEVFGPVFTQLYAQTEAPNTACVLRKEEHDASAVHKLGSCGRPMAGVDVSLLAPDDTPVARGEVGEICIRGPLVMDGYWKQPVLTQRTLRNGWLHTGDLARQDEEGYIFIVDRAKDMIISGGFNVYAREIEDVLTAHPDVAEASVVGLPDEKWGESVVAAIVTRGGVVIDPDVLVDAVRRAKGHIHAPKAIRFVEAIPKTALAKPDKARLRELLAGSPS